MRRIQGYGALRDHPDPRDIVKTTKDVKSTPLKKYSLRDSPFMPTIWNQLNLGSCTAHGVGRCFAFVVALVHDTSPMTPSRLWLYFKERLLEGTTGSDSGATVRDGFKVVTSEGCPPENVWPYDPDKFSVIPPAEVDADAVHEEVIKYRRLLAPTIQHIKNCLAASHTPIAFGFVVYESFETMIGADGLMPMPAAGEQIVGGHCVAIVGFDDDKQCLEVANSWGDSWGDAGYFWMPYAFVTPDYTFDFWQAETAD